MSEADWARFDGLARERAAVAPSQARAYGEAIVRLMDESARRPEPGPLDWMDWERRKTLRLLHRPLDH